MKLLIAIVQKQDSQKLATTLTKNHFSLTKVDSMGGFLREKNSTFLIGCSAKQVSTILALIKQTCKEREELIDSQPAMGEELLLSSATKIKVGGATVFELNTVKTHKL